MNKTTAQVANELGMPKATLISHIHRGSVTAPYKSASNEFWWSPEDVERLKKELAAWKNRKQAAT